MILEVGKTYRFKSDVHGPEDYFVSSADGDTVDLIKQSDKALVLGFASTIHSGAEKYWTEVPAIEIPKQKFIIWGPSGRTNPKVVLNSEEEADKVAISMTQYHRQQFYTAELKSNYKAVTTVTVEKQATV